MNAIMMLHRAMAGYLAEQGGGGESKYIEFADPAVEAVLMAKGVSSDGIGITTADVEKVTSIGTWFNSNTTIENFDEFEKFTGVTTLGNNNTSTAPFYNCTSLKSIKIPKSVTSIKVSSFHGCTSLEIDDLSLPNLTSLGQNAFYGVKIKKISDLGKITALPTANSSTQNFGDKSVLEEVVLPATITTIAANSLYYYTALKSLAVNWDGITQIGDGAFRGVSCLPKSLILPSLTSTLGSGAIRETNIEEILDLGSITTFDAYAAYNCLSLNKVVLPETITAINAQAFAFCSALKVVVCKANTPPTLNSQAFMLARAIEAIYVPSTSVDAYKAATNWTTYADRIGPLEDYEDGGWVKFADPAVEAICVANWDTNGSGYMSENECAAVTSIGTVFNGNTEITSFDEFEKFTGVTSVSPLWDDGQYAFQGCTNLSSIKLPEKLATIGIAAFDGCVSLSDIDLTNVKIIKAAAFRNSGIKLLNCPNLEGTIEWATFKGSSLENIMSLGNITSLDSISNNGAFMECSLLRQAILPNTLKIIAHASFAQCTSLGYIEMQSNVEEIGSYAFNGIKSGATVICKATTPPLLAEGNYGFGSASIYVPDASVDAYKAATNWAAYAAQIKPLSEYDPATEVTFEQGVKLQNSGTTTTDSTMCTTSYMPISNSKSVKWGNTNGSIGIMCEYKDGNTFSDYWGSTQNPRTVNLTGGTSVKYIRASFPIATLDYCYVLDVTNNVYLYKGSKVE